MSTVSTRILKDRLSEYLRRAEAGERILVLRDGKPVAAVVPMTDVSEWDEDARLTDLAARGLVGLPRQERRFQGPRAPGTEKLASEMVIEDRR